MLAYNAFVICWRLLTVILVFACAFASRPALSNKELENELLLELRLDGVALGIDILGYQRGNDFLLSLSELASGLAFPIEIDAIERTASGWMIAPNRTFFLDMAESTVTSDGQTYPIQQGEAIFFDDDLFVNSSAIESWFPLQLSTVLRELYVDVQPEEMLPIQQRVNRRERVLVSNHVEKGPLFPLQATPYQFFSPPVTRLRVGYATTRQSPESDAQYGVSYASLTRNDLGWMTSTLSLSGQSSEALTGARLKLERTAFAGPFGLNHIELGDVDADGYRGLLVRGGGNNRSGSGRFDHEFVDIDGSQLPDWDVELYQNGQLILIQTTGDDGRYLFKDVPLVFGENRFELKFFGPSGETESREETYFLGPGMLEAGGMSYTLSAVQNGRTVFDVIQAESEADEDSLSFAGDLNLGLSRNLTAGAGVRSLEIDGERRETRNLGLSLSSAKLFGSVRFLDTSDAQDSLNASVRTRLSDTSINLGYTQFFKDPITGGFPQKWRANAVISATAMSLPIRFELATQELDNSTAYNAVLGTTRRMGSAGQLSTALWYGATRDYVEQAETRFSQAGGQTSLYSIILPWTFRLTASYGIRPEAELLEYSAKSSLRIDRDLTLDVDVRRNPVNEKTYYAGGINWRLDKLALNARVSYDSDERWGGLITVSTTVLNRRGTLSPDFDSSASLDAGNVEVLVFEDRAEEGRIPLADVTINGVQAWRSGKTNEKGIAYLSRMPAYRQIDVAIDESTLAESELRAKKRGASIISRPGSYAVVEFPVVRTAEIEGHVVISEGEQQVPARRVLISLISDDGEIVAQSRTAFDGFYLFEGIEPGRYRVALDQKLEDRVLEKPDQLNIGSDSGIIRGLDFTLSPKREEKLALTSLINDSPDQRSSSQISGTISGAAIPALRTSQTQSAGNRSEQHSQARSDTSDKTAVKPASTNEPRQPSGNWFVQLGAYGTQKLALQSWEQIRQSSPVFQGTFARYSPHRGMVRLLVGPGSTQVQANQFCEYLKAREYDCLIRQIE